MKRKENCYEEDSLLVDEVVCLRSVDLMTCMLRQKDVEFIKYWNSFKEGFTLSSDVSCFETGIGARYNSVKHKSCFDTAWWFKYGVPLTEFKGESVGIAIGVIVSRGIYALISQGHRVGRSCHGRMVVLAEQLDCHAWNLLRGKVVDVTNGSYIADKMVYLGWQVTESELTRCKSGMSLRRLLYKKLNTLEEVISLN